MMTWRQSSTAAQPSPRGIRLGPTMGKILIVDDDKGLCDVIESWLSYERHVVECVHSGDKAIQLLSTFHYDAVILD